MSLEDEAGLITKILEEADIRTVIKQKVTHKFFQDATNREVFHWLVMRFQKYGRVPTLRLVQREFPEFEPVGMEEDITELIEEVKNAKLYSDLADSIKQVTEATREDPQDGYAKLREMAGRLTLTHSNTDDIDITKNTNEILAEFKSARDGEGVMGIPYPWPYMNRVTLGMHPGELIGIYARPKSMKTWVALSIAEYVHTHTGKTPAFFSGEMPVIQIQKRLAALKAKLPYTAFRSGMLTKKQELRFKKALTQLREESPFFICKIEGMGDEAITEVRAKCEEYQIDLAVCDGIYFWMEDESHKAFRTITRGLKKNVAEALKIPVIGVTQANRSSEKDKGKSTTGVAFGDSLAQDCDQLLHIVREQQHKEQRELLITMPAMREAEGGTFTINAMPAESFEEKFVFEGDDDLSDDSDDDSSIMG